MSEPDPGYAGDVEPSAAFELLRRDDRAVLVDVRTRAEWSYVGIPDLSGIGKQTVLVEWVDFPAGARNPGFLSELADAGVGPDAPLLFICRSGQRSIGAARAATAAGLGPAYNVLDGFEGPADNAGHRGSSAGWKVQGLPWRQG